MWVSDPSHAPMLPLDSLTPPLNHRRLAILARAMALRPLSRISTDPSMVMAVATPDGTCDLQIPRDRYDPFATQAMVVG